LQELAASTSRLLAIDCTFEFAGEKGFTHPWKATHLYRIAQEAINNARKHGKAQNVEMRLSANPSAMSLSIADDGAGFSKTEKAVNGVGISIMRYRANVVGGEFEIEERPNGGTVVSCTVPAEA
jgi:signal transduction histidine kinase